jgi:hypothetical protein
MKPRGLRAPLKKYWHQMPQVDCTLCAAKSSRYDVNCDGCKARHLSRSPSAYKSRRLGFATDQLKRDVRMAFGNNWVAGLEMVRAQ